jgi:hypothetical protein
VEASLLVVAGDIISSFKLLAMNTTLRNDLGKAQTEPCIISTFSKGIQDAQDAWRIASSSTQKSYCLGYFINAMLKQVRGML